MLGQQTKKLIIVVDKKTNVYGELLSALISMKDDKTDGEEIEVVGVRDGSIDAAIWDEKTYADNLSQLGSSQKIVFIGKNDVSKPVMQNINCTNDFSKYGVFYGSLGNKAIVHIDEKPLMKKNAYDEFINSYSAFIDSVGKEYANNQEIAATKLVQDVVYERKEKVRGVLNKGLNAIKSVPTPFGKKKESTDATDSQETESGVNDLAVNVVDSAKGLVLPLVIAEDIKLGIVRVKSAKEIRDQQYRCGIVLFYIYHLAKFME